MGRIRTSVAAGLLVMVTACTASEAPEEGDDTMNQDQARTHLVEVVREVLAAAAPEEADALAEVVDVPCGGLGGNEWNKVKHTLESADGIRVADRESALEAVRTLVEDRGWELSDRGDAVGFSTGDVRGTAWVRESGVLVSAETGCLDNQEG